VILQNHKGLGAEQMKAQKSTLANFLFLSGTFFLLLFCTKICGQSIGPFPPNFIWAVATSAYQVEGGWNASGMI
jgi:hypothetical protein